MEHFGSRWESPRCRFGDVAVLSFLVVQCLDGAFTYLGVSFWGLDGCNMDDDFAFSFFRTREEWEADKRQWEEFNREFDRKWKEEHPDLVEENFESLDSEGDDFIQ